VAAGILCPFGKLSLVFDGDGIGTSAFQAARNINSEESYIYKKRRLPSSLVPDQVSYILFVKTNFRARSHLHV
jgi:hypothetical protein